MLLGFSFSLVLNNFMLQNENYMDINAVWSTPLSCQSFFCRLSFWPSFSKCRQLPLTSHPTVGFFGQDYLCNACPSLLWRVFQRTNQLPWNKALFQENFCSMLIDLQQWNCVWDVWICSLSASQWPQSSHSSGLVTFLTRNHTKTLYYNILRTLLRLDSVATRRKKRQAMAEHRWNINIPQTDA